MSKTVLVVDDLPLMRMVLKRVLQREGYKVLEASNGKVALEVISNLSSLPDLIILDVMMPVMDGFTFINELKEKFAGKVPVPIIILSARETKEDVLKAIELGARDYIVKPFENNELLTKIKKILHGGN
jgi:DNA-binding response OmpR family regulator